MSETGSEFSSYMSDSSVVSSENSESSIYDYTPDIDDNIPGLKYVYDSTYKLPEGLLRILNNDPDIHDEGFRYAWHIMRMNPTIGNIDTIASEVYQKGDFPIHSVADYTIQAIIHYL